MPTEDHPGTTLNGVKQRFFNYLNHLSPFSEGAKQASSHAEDDLAEAAKWSQAACFQLFKPFVAS